MERQFRCRLTGRVFRVATLAVVAVAVTMAGCGRVSPGLDASMREAGDNQAEIAAAMSHYSHGSDSLKAAAMEFLVNNMSGKGTLAGPFIDECYTFIDSIYGINQPEYDIPGIYAAFRAGARHAGDRPERVYDSSVLTASYLIDNVEGAMRLCGRPWNSHLTFSQFCEFLLPYRVGSEEAGHWRETYGARFAPLVAGKATALEAATAINDSLRRLPAHIALEGVLPVTMRPSTLYNMKFGLCSDYAALAVYAMRSAGVPVTLNVIPQWGRKNGSHVFNAVLDNDGRWYDFSGAEDNPGDHLHRFKGGIPKIYRKGFGRNPESLAALCGSEEIPSLFQDATMVDVTSDFDAVDACDVTVDVPGGTRSRFAYICVFTPAGWMPVGWGAIDGGKVTFRSVGKGIVYQAALYADGVMKPFGEAFMPGSDGRLRFMVAGDGKEDVELWRKHPVSETLIGYPQDIVGGRFEGADNPGFYHREVLHQIVDTPDFRFTTVELPPTRPFRYLRYVSSDSTYGNMAEVEFIDPVSRRIEGSVIGGYKPSIYYPRNGAAMLFDGDALTFFHTSDAGSWGGLCLRVPTEVAAIRFLIRNDDNGVRRGHDYELFYAAGGSWRSLGRVKAEADDEIRFGGVPRGALLWLHDHTGGYEERIFEYNNGKIIWH